MAVKWAIIASKTGKNGLLQSVFQWGSDEIDEKRASFFQFFVKSIIFYYCATSLSNAKNAKIGMLKHSTQNTRNHMLSGEKLNQC